MSGRSEPQPCDCRFCGDSFTPAGITNHERWCDDNPEPGVDPDRAEELGIYDSSAVEEPRDSTEAPDDPTDPDQRKTASDGGLPDTTTLSGSGKSLASVSDTSDTEESTSECPNCGGTSTIPSHRARQKTKEELGYLPDALGTTFDATERYCNDCYSVFGGKVEGAHSLGGDA